MNYLSSLSLLVLTVGLWACGGQTDKRTGGKSSAGQLDDTAVPVKLMPVESVVRAEPIVASGLVSSAQEVKLSFKIGGIIQTIYVKEGETVQKGQLLATLNLTEIDAQVSQAKLASEKAERDLNRARALYSDSAATLEQLQNARTGQNVARQNLTIAKFNQGYAQIRAIVDGTISRKLMSEGEMAPAGAPVFLVSSNRNSDWVVRVGISDKDWARLKLGDRATIALDAYPDHTFTGSISKLAQSADPLNKLYEVEVHINPEAVKFANGLFAKVTLQSSQSRSYVRVPVEAIVEGNGKEGFVYILAEDQKHVRKQAVQIAYIEGDKVLLTNGLSEKSKVVMAGSAYLNETSTVIVN